MTPGSVSPTNVRSLRSPVSVPARNPGLPFDDSWLRSVRVNPSAVERRIESLAGRRTVKKEWQAAWLLKAISCIDLTTLAGDDTDGRVARLCAKAKQPLRQDLVDALGIAELGLTTGAVCVYHDMIPAARAALGTSAIPIAAVSTGFPAGLAPLETRLKEIELSVAAGAREIDVVISRRQAFAGDWRALYEEVRQFRARCGEAHIKVILATGELAAPDRIAKASLVAMMAGADFIKTSTGMEGINATLPVSLVMVRAIREFHERTGAKVGFKPAGGITSAKQALSYLILMKEELGSPWLSPLLFRFGASRLLADIERQLEHFVSGRYSAGNRHPLA